MLLSCELSVLVRSPFPCSHYTASLRVDTLVNPGHALIDWCGHNTVYTALLGHLHVLMMPPAAGLGPPAGRGGTCWARSSMCMCANGVNAQPLLWGRAVPTYYNASFPKLRLLGGWVPSAVRVYTR